MSATPLFGHKPRVLVTTANGRTGSAAVRELLVLGHRVRAFVSRDDPRAAAWRSKGVEVVVGSLYDFRDLQRALTDVQRIYHCPPFDSRHLHGSALLALAAQEAGVEVIALMSGWNPHPTHKSVLQREHWITNNLFRRQAFDVIHINPGMFAFTYFLGLPAAAHLGMLALPFGDGLNAAPSNEDIGMVAAHSLSTPQSHIGQCLRPMGPKRMHGSDVAQVLGSALNRKVSYRPVSESMFVKFARAQGFPLFQIAQVRHYARECREGVFAQEPNDHVQRVTGRAPEGMETIVRRFRDDPTRIMPGFSLGSRASAIGLMVRALLTRVPDLDAWERSRDYPSIERGTLAHEDASWRRASAADELVLLPGGRYAARGGEPPTAHTP
ncbi:MAG: NmrA family NAD(P)-binding protein [Nannocystaceae bacterium]|nr:NmrA family NAD(P)-binding protein [Nannocystaceae bacterium]